MRTIVCFGDSNTYGYRPDNKQRYSIDKRWPGILRSRLEASDTQVIEEGLVGRTTVFEDSLRQGRKGIDFLIPILESHSPVNDLVLMLGTNDCKTHYKASPSVIGRGIEKLIDATKKYNPDIHILLLSPIFLGEDVWKEEYDPEFDKESVETSKRLKEIYKKISEKYGCDFLAASDIANPSTVDQEHLDEEGHKKLAEKIFEKIIKR